MKAQQPNDTMANSAFPYATADHEHIPCNLCGGTDLEVLARRDRNGLAVQSSICRSCGLIFISPRMTQRWYTEYYQQEYREQMARFRGKKVTNPDHESLYKSSIRHGITLARHLRSEWRRGLTLEVGSSTGGVLAGIRDELGVDVLGIEPSPEEANFAIGKGIPTFVSLIESFDTPIPAPSTVLCTQSLNHFLDPRFFLTWAHEKLAPEGLLVLEVMNFRHVFQRYGWMPRAIQVDHTFMFVPEVLGEFVQAAGFDVLRLESDEKMSREEQKRARSAGAPGMHITVVARKSERKPFTPPVPRSNHYKAVMKSLETIPNHRWLYFLRYELKKMLKRSNT